MIQELRGMFWVFIMSHSSRNSPEEEEKEPRTQTALFQKLA